MRQNWRGGAINEWVCLSLAEEKRPFEKEWLGLKVSARILYIKVRTKNLYSQCLE